MPGRNRPPAAGSRRHRAPARGAHRGCARDGAGVHGRGDPVGGHRAAAGFHRADARRLAGADRRSRRHAGRDPRHQYRSRRGDEFRAGRRRRAADESERAQPGAVERHADRSAERTAGRALRPECPGRRDHHDDAQAGRRDRGRTHRRATAATTATRAVSISAGPLGGNANGSISAYTRSTDGQFENSSSAATTAWTTSRSPASPAG